jgi:hypothetical protein
MQAPDGRIKIDCIVSPFYLTIVCDSLTREQEFDEIAFSIIYIFI